MFFLLFFGDFSNFVYICDTVASFNKKKTFKLNKLWISIIICRFWAISVLFVYKYAQWLAKLISIIRVEFLCLSRFFFTTYIDTDYMWLCVSVYRALLSLYVSNGDKWKKNAQTTFTLYILSTIFHSTP